MGIRANHRSREGPGYIYGEEGLTTEGREVQDPSVGSGANR